MKPTDREMAILSERAYHEHTVQNSGVELLFQHFPEYATVSSRGTTFDGFDIIMDMRGCPWWAKEFNCWTHRGFLIDARNIWPLFKPWAMALTVPLYYGGHSKGGANATYLAAKAVIDPDVPNPAGLITQGCPPIGRGLKRILHSISGARYRFGRDIVPCLGLGIGHERPVARIGDKGGPLTDHRIRNYIDASPAE